MGAGTDTGFAADDLAGVVDLFGALTSAELCDALTELAFRRGEDRAPDSFADDVTAACRTYHLVAVDANNATATDESPVLVVGPAAFPALPDGGPDLPHIMDVPERNVSRTAAARAAESRFRADAAAAVEAGDGARIADLIDVSYELEAWGPVDLATVRARLDDARGETN